MKAKQIKLETLPQNEDEFIIWYQRRWTRMRWARTMRDEKWNAIDVTMLKRSQFDSYGNYLVALKEENNIMEMSSGREWTNLNYTLRPTNEPDENELMVAKMLLDYQIYAGWFHEEWKKWLAERRRYGTCCFFTGIWEKTARRLIHGVMLAMLEDSLDPELGMTREKFNFYNLTKIATHRDTDGENMMKTLQQYTTGRDILSKVPALTSTVVNNAPNTTRSYLGVLQPKIAIFQDMGICYCTSATDVSFTDFTDKPTVLFIKVPDERESRHAIATMCISQMYKTLILTASARPNLQLQRPVYFLLDEFANLPKVDKMDTIITVARSRKIFFEMAIQSYSQLDNKYTKEVADTIKGNCNIQIFIGTEDQKTREEFSKMCGEVTLKTKNISENKSDKKEPSWTCLFVYRKQGFRSVLCQGVQTASLSSCHYDTFKLHIFSFQSNKMIFFILVR